MSEVVKQKSHQCQREAHVLDQIYQQMVKTRTAAVFTKNLSTYLEINTNLMQS